jgi:hypothetical protein
MRERPSGGRSLPDCGDAYRDASIDACVKAG